MKIGQETVIGGKTKKLHLLHYQYEQYLIMLIEDYANEVVSYIYTSYFKIII